MSGVGDIIHDDASRPITVWRVQNANGEGIYATTVADDLSLAMQRYASARWGAEAAIEYFKYSEPLPEATLPNAPHDPYMEALVHEFYEHPHVTREAWLPQFDFYNDEWAALPAKEQRKYLFGFAKKSDAAVWFGPQTLKHFARQGFQVTPVKARKVVLSKSGRQVIFIPAVELSQSLFGMFVRRR